MHLIWLKLTAGARGRDVAGQTLADILWASARPEDKVEHISVRTDADAPGLLVAMFVRAGAPDAAPTAALRVVRAAIATSPPLADWTVCFPEPAMPPATGECAF